jgi:hypothetical protein
MLPRVALEYGQTMWAFCTKRRWATEIFIRRITPRGEARERLRHRD